MQINKMFRVVKNVLNRIGRALRFKREIARKFKHSPAGTKFADQANSGICTLRGQTLHGSDLMMRFYNKRYSNKRFAIKVM